jgi:hypothetical protein
VSALIQAVDHAAHGYHAEEYASFRSNTAQSIMADLAALIAGQSDHIPYPVAKNLFAYLTAKVYLPTNATRPPPPCAAGPM